ncbi:hypothetical protein [Paracoccus sp. (in: a-proteobacteria)]|uniref:hypothetical protein n=1 Tax=Paracoccus sp. TaxID=267 RepID=UPI0028AB1270|nr:hypothetical protein [Paracoccus sp. (in: a-proteobacteria)]
MAVLVLLMWPIVMIWMFSRFDRQKALILSLVAGYLALPPLLTFFVPGFPGFDKHSIPSVVAAIILASKQGSDPFPDAPAMGPVIKMLLAIFIFTPFLTDVLNGDVLIDGNIYRPGLTVISGTREVIHAFFLVLPMLLGYRYLHDYRGAKLLCWYMVLAILWYSILMLLEIRLSPQLNVWVYGYFQHDFIQTIRYGGYRPIVFLEHPLWVASIASVAFVFSVGLIRSEKIRFAKPLVGYLAFVLFICKSAGALILSAFFIPLMFVCSPKRVLLIAAFATSVAILYPVLRSTPLLPVEKIVDLAMSASPERGRSLEFRLMNEERLLERAMEKPLLGWGGSGRSLIVDPYDGGLMAIPDGLWVIYLGSRGLIGYLSVFLLLAAPVYLMYRAVSKHRSGTTSEYQLLVAMAVAVTMNIIDLIPNATLTPITWLIAGSLLGNAARVYSGNATPTTILEVEPTSRKPGLATIL